MEYLDKNNLWKNTIIIFTSDNGYNGSASSDKNLRGCKGEIIESQRYFIYTEGIWISAIIT